MRHDEVEQKTGFKSSHIYNLMKQGRFPKANAWGCGSRLGLSGNRALNCRTPFATGVKGMRVISVVSPRG